MLVLIVLSIWYLDLDKVFDETNIFFKINTGLPTKNDTLETIVQNLYSSTIPCNCKLVCFFAKSLKKQWGDYI